MFIRDSNDIYERLYVRGIQIGNIVTKRENVGRTSTVGTRDNAVRRFTYDVSGREQDGRATDDRNKGDGRATDGRSSREAG